MCNVCKDEQCHWGEYCYPTGVSVRLARRMTTDEQKVAQRALRRSVKVVAKGKPVTD